MEKPSMNEKSIGDIRILALEDEPSMQKFIRICMEGEGYECIAVDSVREAETRMGREPFDLLLCDIALPGESGLDFAIELAGRKQDIAIVMLTGRDDPVLWRKALENNIHAYLVKPVEKHQLCISAANALHRLHLERTNRRHLSRLERVAEKLRTVNRELKRANKRILDQQKRLVERERLQVLLELAGATAHELNQPLTTLLAYIELMEEEYRQPAKMLEYARHAANSGERIADIVRRIQSIRKDSTVPYVGKYRITNLHTAINDCGKPVSGDGRTTRLQEVKPSVKEKNP